MIYLEQIVNQILKEEGQTIVTLEDLQISWADLEELFVGIYEQSKQYLSIYDWTTDTLGLDPTQKSDWAHVRHMNINAYYQRLMPDYPGNYWEFNPYTHNASSLANISYNLEVGKYPTLENLECIKPIKINKDRKTYFSLPCTFQLDDFSFLDFAAYYDRKDNTKILLESEKGVGQFSEKTLNGYIIMDEDYSGELKVLSKYVGIKELGMECELFYVWFKAALMQYIGSMKRQLDLTGVGLPFDINADGLLERGRQLMDRVEELKTSKQHWSNF